MASAAQPLNVRARPCLGRLRWLVDERNDARTERLCVYKSQRRRAPLAKQTLSVPQPNRIDQQPIFIDQVMLHQRADKLATAVDQEVLVGLLLQLGDLFGDVALQRRGAPLELV